MLKALAFGLALSTGLVLGGMATIGGLAYVGANKLEEIGKQFETEFAAFQNDNPDHSAPSWPDYSDCLSSGATAPACAAFRPDAALEAAARGQSMADYVMDACNERMDVNFATCINEFYPN